MKFSYLLLGAVAAIEIKQASITKDQIKQFISVSQKLGLDMTDDMMVGQSADDISGAIVGAALEAGKSQTDIETAMGGEAAPADEAQAATTDSAAEAPDAAAASAEAEAASTSDKKERLTEVKVEVLKKGKGHKCKDSQIASMQYTGMLYADESKVFDSNAGSEDFQFTVGGYTVIKCW